MTMIFFWTKSLLTPTQLLRPFKKIPANVLTSWWVFFLKLSYSLKHFSLGVQILLLSLFQCAKSSTEFHLVGPLLEKLSALRKSSCFWHIPEPLGRIVKMGQFKTKDNGFINEVKLYFKDGHSSPQIYFWFGATEIHDWWLPFEYC